MLKWRLKQYYALKRVPVQNGFRLHHASVNSYFASLRHTKNLSLKKDLHLMRPGYLLSTFVLLLTVLNSQGQRIVYSEPEKDDSRRMNFEIIGKVGGNFLIYKEVHNKNYIAVYNNDMIQTSK